MPSRYSRFYCTIAFLLLLASCGGGDSSSLKAEADTRSITFTSESGGDTPEPQSFIVTIKNLDQYEGVLDTVARYNTTILSNIDYEILGDYAVITLYPKSPSSLKIGDFKDNVSIEICYETYLDYSIPCTNNIPGSPLIIDINYRVIVGDADNDGLTDDVDNDDDNDNVPDSSDALPLDPSESVDTDGDGIGNNADWDDDNDNVNDTQDAFPLDPSESVDTDGDGIGNNADLDDDNDNVNDKVDALPLDPLESMDTDGDGIGNNADLDDDNDNVNDTEDTFPLDPSESSDTDGDGVGNNSDTDIDNDGVENLLDQFPIDVAASLDSDNDGYPDAWNTGYSENNSTTGLMLDSFPDDSECWLPSHDDGQGQCNPNAAIPDFIPNSIVTDIIGNVYFYIKDEQKVYRLSSIENRYIAPITLDLHISNSPNLMTYSSAHNRLYFGYSSGEITYVELTTGDLAEQVFANVPLAVGGLASVGEFVLAQDASGAWNTHYIYDETGNLTDSKEWNRYSSEYAWNPVNHRVYFFRDQTLPNDLHYEEINQLTGEIVAEGETPYHGGYSMIPPIRISTDGSQVILGSGDIYDANDLTWLGSIPNFDEGLWLSNGELVVLRQNGSEFTLTRYSSNRSIIEATTFIGTALSLQQEGNDYLLIRQNSNGDIITEVYVPNDDSDGDGVINTDDRFPLDIAASLDNDNDGYPDAWNTGYSENDSTEGLVLDSYPNDSACWLPSHDDGQGQCDFSATMPNFTPDSTIADADGKVYLFSSLNQTVYVWSSETKSFTNPIYLANSTTGNAAVTLMTYSSAHNRLYFGYSSGEITYVDLANGDLAEQAFTNLPQGVGALVSVGEFVFTQDNSGGDYIIDETGNLTDIDGVYSSRAYAWNPVNNRIYSFRDGISPNDLHYKEINQLTGEIVAEGETPYHGGYSMIPPIRISADGSQVILGSGDIYDANDLTWLGSIPDFDEGLWLSNGELVVLRQNGSEFTLTRYSSNRSIIEATTLIGTALSLQQAGNDYLQIRQKSNGDIIIEVYIPNDDSDGDGVSNTDDRFPLDIAASLDKDNDGYPDAWNTGYSENDSTEGLVLDSYPKDSACWLPSHDDGQGQCDYRATMPNFTPDSTIADADGKVYLFSSLNQTVYVWSSETGDFTNPIYLANSTTGNTAVTLMTYSSAHNRLYFGYSSGEITYVELTIGNFAEQAFANLPLAVGGLASVGEFVLAQDASGGWNTHYIYDETGNLTDSEDSNYYSREYAWNPVNHRVYFFGDNFIPNDLHYEEINQLTGEIVAEGRTPYHVDYSIIPPIRISVDGSQVILGSGDIFDANDLTRLVSIPDFDEGLWLSNGELVVLRQNGSGFTLTRYSSNRSIIETKTFTGTALSLQHSGDNYLLVSERNNQLIIEAYVPSN